VEKNILQLVDLLKHGEILQAPALPLKRKGFYADMALVTTKGNTKIVAEGVDLSDGEETFFLNLDEYHADKYWLDKQGVSAWPPRPDEKNSWTAVDLVLDIRRSGLDAVLKSNRQVRFYRSANVSQIGFKGVLQSVAAVSLTSSVPSEGMLFIYATPELPCSIEVTMEPPRIETILAGLEECYPTWS
jgi:hypothetical protein